MNKNSHTNTQLYKIIEKNADGIIIVNGKGIVRFANPAAEILFDRPAQELLGELFGFPIVAADRTEIDIVHHSKREVIVEMRVVDIVWEDENAYLVSLRDITRHKQTEKSLREHEAGMQETLHALRVHQKELRIQNEDLTIARQESEILRRKYQRLFDFAPIGYLTLDRDSLIREINLTGAGLLGYERDHLIGKPLLLYVTVNSREILVAHLQGVFKGSNATVEVTFEGQNQRIFPVMLHSVAIEDQNRAANPLCLTAAMDITQRLQVQEALQKAHDELDKRVKERTAELAQLYRQTQQDAETKAILLKEVNHRVKNNLSAIIGLLYTEQSHHRIVDEVTYHAVMDDLITRIEGLAAVHDLLSASGWTPLRLDELTAQIIDAALQTLPPDRMITVEVSPTQIHVLPRQANNLALVINELTTNTAKYALEEGSQSHILVQIRDEDNGVTLTFQDDGPGYPPPILRREGFSVGLDLVQRITRQDLGGEVTFQNSGGAVTIIHFPAL
ncbi:MAG: PAS domain S-box protein [Anaerolineales bacterium]|nr:PAS domain S-box protein [Anaerolineales bacterium]